MMVLPAEVVLESGHVSQTCNPGNVIVPPTILDNLHRVTKLPWPTIDLEPIVQELFECSAIENTVVCRLGVVNDNLLQRLA